MAPHHLLCTDSTVLCLLDIPKNMFRTTLTIDLEEFWVGLTYRL